MGRRGIVGTSIAINVVLAATLAWGWWQYRSLPTPETPLNDPVTRTYRWTAGHELTVEGRAFADTTGPYDRLPKHAESRVPPNVWKLGHQAAGVCVRFITDSPEMAVRWTLRSNRLALPDMPAAAVSGLDLYARDPQGRLRWLAVAHPTGQVNECVLIKGLDGQQREYCLYLPLYNGVEQLELGVLPEASLRPAPARPGPPLVFYGTSITQGRAASRPGMAYPAILGRLLDRPVINLGFSGSCKMDLGVIELMAQIDAAVYLVDCLPNMDGDLVRQRAEGVVRRLHAARPGTPIVLLEDRTYPAAPFRSDLAEHQRRSRQALRDALDKLQAEGIGPLLYVTGDELLANDDDACADGSHPTDVGMRRISERLESLLKDRLLEAPVAGPQSQFAQGEEK